MLGVATATASVAVALTAATPANAAGTPYFEIFYSPSCKGASRIYQGVNSGEAWINDQFNLSGQGAAGLNQKIAYNAASVRVTNAQVTINYNQNLWWQQRSHGSTCFNLENPYRNNNRNFTIEAY